MNRIPEPELMEDAEQVRAYAQADFSIPHTEFIERLTIFIDQPAFAGVALDLGCGPGDISRRFARAFPRSEVHALDGSKAMLAYAESTPALAPRVQFFHCRLPDTRLPCPYYAVIFSNSLLHHLPDASIMWNTIKKHATTGTRVAVMDLVRPASADDARNLVERYAGDEPKILQRDFYHSLLAAFTLDEIGAQLASAGLAFQTEQITDRHVFINRHYALNT